MAQDVRIEEIDGLTFHVQQMGGKKGTRLWIEILGIVGPALAKAVAGMKLNGDSVSLLDLELNDLSGAAEYLFSKLDPDRFMSILERLCEPVRVERDGKLQPLWPVFDLAMQGKPMTTLMLTKLALEVNFGPLPEGLGDLLRAQVQAQVSKSQAGVTTSPGPSGGSSSSASQL